MSNPPRPTRHRSIRARRWTAASVLALTVGVSACSGDSEGAESSTTTAPATTTTASTTTTTAVVTTTTLPAAGRPEPDEAALALLGSWEADDRVGASLVADPAAVEALFAAPRGAYRLYSRCDTGEFGTGGCLYRDRSNNNTIQINVERRNENWVVTSAFFSPG